MNKYKLIALKIIDRFIRFMGLIGGAILAVIGLILGWWDNEVGSLVYGIIFLLAWLYCLECNGEDWAY